MEIWLFSFYQCDQSTIFHLFSEVGLSNIQSLNLNIWASDHLLVLDEGILVDGLDDIFEEDLGGESVAMVDDGLTVLTIPTVHCGARKIKKRLYEQDSL